MGRWSFATFRLSVHNRQVPTPTSQNLKVKRQYIKNYQCLYACSHAECRVTHQLLESLKDWIPQFLYFVDLLYISKKGEIWKVGVGDWQSMQDSYFGFAGERVLFVGQLIAGIFGIPGSSATQWYEDMALRRNHIQIRQFLFSSKPHKNKSNKSRCYSSLRILPWTEYHTSLKIRPWRALFVDLCWTLGESARSCITTKVSTIDATFRRNFDLFSRLPFLTYWQRTLVARRNVLYITVFQALNLVRKYDLLEYTNVMHQSLLWSSLTCVLLPYLSYFKFSQVPFICW